jgi:hypothetical protein
VMWDEAVLHDGDMTPALAEAPTRGWRSVRTIREPRPIRS